MHCVRQCDRVLHRKFGAGTDREVRGRLGVAQQHHIVPDPAFASDHGEITPHRAIDEELMALKEPAENTGHAIGGLLLVQPLESGAPERCEVSLEDPGRTPNLVLVRVSDERAHSVSWKINVKASSGRVEPIQANLFERRSTSGWKWSIYLSRKRLLMPSASTTRSASAKRASSSISVSKSRLTPSSRARS